MIHNSHDTNILNYPKDTQNYYRNIKKYSKNELERMPCIRCRKLALNNMCSADSHWHSAITIRHEELCYTPPIV